MSPVCPNDLKKSVSVVCRPNSDGGCDIEERCSGGNDCPVDAFLPGQTVCSESLGVCDPSEKCTGNNGTCPANVFASSATICSPATCSLGVANLAVNCSGSSASCSVPATASCAPYSCQNTSQCKTNCATDTDCASTHFCSGTLCQAKKLNGAMCASANECIGNMCSSSFADIDRDGFGAGPAIKSCGPVLNGYSTVSTDCCDSDDRAKPGQTMFFDTPRMGLCPNGNALPFDFNCDGSQTVQFSQAPVACATSGLSCGQYRCPDMGRSGFQFVAPACGGTGTFILCNGTTPTTCIPAPMQFQCMITSSQQKSQACL
jgi:hypothetical protein